MALIILIMIKHLSVFIKQKRSPAYATIFLLSVITLLNALIANRIGLSVDEAHYALYGSHLAWSYFDHPPLVGWLQALILPFSHSDFALRIWPMIFNIGSSWILYILSRDLFPHENRWFSFSCVATLQSAIIINILGLAWIPQTPFIFFGLATLFFLYRSVQHERVPTFILFGISMGLAALAEYTAFFLALVSVLYILSTKPRLFRHYPIWLTAFITMIFISPILLWNIQHDWISFTYQHKHVLISEQWSWQSFLLSELVQFFAYAPGIFIFACLGLLTSRKDWRSPPVRLLAIFILLLLLFFVYGSGYTFTLPHWTALAWIASIPLSLRYIYRYWQNTLVKVIVWISGLYSVLLILFIHIFVWPAWLNLPLAQQPLRDLYGWNTAAQMGKQWLLKEPHANSQSPKLFVPNWTLASRIAWYAQYPVQIAAIQGVSQFTLWYGIPAQDSYGILIIPYSWNTPPQIGTLPGQFKTCQFLQHLPIYVSQHLVNTFDFYYCTGFLQK